MWFFIRGNKPLSDKKSLARPASVEYRKQNHFCLHTEKPMRDNMKITRHHSSHFVEDYCILSFHLVLNIMQSTVSLAIVIH